MPAISQTIKVGGAEIKPRYIRTLKPGDLIYREGSEAQTIYLMQAGLAFVEIDNAIVEVIEPGVFFGEGCFAGRVRQETIFAVAPSGVVEFLMHDVMALIQKEPTFAASFVGCLIERGIAQRDKIVDQITCKVETRLARTLIRLSRAGEIQREILQKDLARMVGTTRPNIAYFVQQFLKLGLVSHRDGKLQVDEARLAVHGQMEQKERKEAARRPRKLCPLGTRQERRSADPVPPARNIGRSPPESITARA
jgi:CRP-like cAMP-binding protein